LSRAFSLVTNVDIMYSRLCFGALSVFVSTGSRGRAAEEDGRACIASTLDPFDIAKGPVSKFAVITMVKECPRQPDTGPATGAF
jgi:hypothetical protein